MVTTFRVDEQRHSRAYDATLGCRLWTETAVYHAGGFANEWSVQPNEGTMSDRGATGIGRSSETRGLSQMLITRWEAQCKVRSAGGPELPWDNLGQPTLLTETDFCSVAAVFNGSTIVECIML